LEIEIPLIFCGGEGDAGHAYHPDPGTQLRGKNNSINIETPRRPAAGAYEMPVAQNPGYWSSQSEYAEVSYSAADPDSLNDAKNTWSRAR